MFTLWGRTDLISGPALAFATPREAVLTHRLGGGVLGTIHQQHPLLSLPAMLADGSRADNPDDRAVETPRRGCRRGVDVIALGDRLIFEVRERRVEHRIVLGWGLGRARRLDVRLD